MQAKPWQIAVMILAGVVLIGSVVYQTTGSGGAKLSTELMMVDGETGELFIVERGKDQTLFFPVARPGSEKGTLLPVVQENGNWVVIDYYKKLIKPEMKAVPDANSGVVVAKEGKPQRFRPS